MAETKATFSEVGTKEPHNALHRLAKSVAALLSIIAVVVVIVILAGGMAMNRSAFLAQHALIDNALRHLVAKIGDEQKSVAVWDDAASHVTSKHVDLAWANVELGTYLTQTYGHTEIYVLSPDNVPVFAFVDGKPSHLKDHVNRVNLFAPLVKQIREGKLDLLKASHARSYNKSLRFLVSKQGGIGHMVGSIGTVDGVPAIVSAITITPNVNMALVQKVPMLLISVVPLNQAIFDDIGSRLLIQNLKFTAMAQGKIPVGMTQIQNDSGSVIAALSWHAPKPGTMMLKYMLPLALAAFAIAGLIAQHLLRRLILSSNNLARREASARHQSLHDSISGLPNRRCFQARLQEALPLSAQDGFHTVVAYVDIDRFKDINDTLGHSIGDSLILKVGARLHASLLPGDVLARLGGDEFGIVRRASTAEAAAQLGTDIQAAFAAPFDLAGQLTKVEVSIGLASSSAHNDSAEMLLRHADIALYNAKDRGRNCVSAFADAMALAVEDRFALEADLRDAILAGNIYMLYQPIIDAQSHQICGVEALVRWKHPLRGIVSPVLFIPLAERAGLMPALGQQIFRKVFADAARWPSLEVSVNLSPAQIRDVGLIPMIEALLAEFRISASQLVFEITEGVLLEATEHALQTLRVLTDRGFKIALDDFGTGYSSLSYLRQFEFHKLKIDRSFVQDVAHKQQSMWIVQAIIALGTGLGMRVVAEGVETESEADMMSNAGCNELQGYYFSRPIEPQAIDAFFEDYAAVADKKTMPL
jgi:diguanylate cyclase (GGDEF)-like protein